MWKNLLEVLFSFLKTWWDAEQREASEWEAKARAGQIEAMKNVRQVSNRIDAAEIKGTASNSVRTWNEKARGAALPGLLFLALSCCGCPFTKYVYVEGPWPVITAPARPVLPEDPPGFTDREMLLVNYSQALETKIGAYNTEALSHNVKHGYTDP